jgi:hypothetical protein
MTSSPQMNKLTSKTRKAFLAAGLLSGAALSSIVFSAPVKAACGVGLVSSIDGTTLECGDKKYTFDPNAFAAFGADFYSITVDGFGTHNFTLLPASGSYGPGTYNLNFSVMTTGVNTIKAYGTDLQAPLGGSASYTMTGAPAGIPPSAIATLSGPGLSVYPGLGVNMATFTSTLQVNAGTSVTSFTSAILQQPPRSSQVPGPLPLLGAGAAFGFSRRIRSRIKAAA